MGRSVKGPKPGNEREYIPESFGNKEDPEPIRVWIQDPTEGEKRKLTLLQTELGFENGEILRDSDGAPQIHITLEAMSKFQQSAILAHVVRVANYEVRGVAIVDGETLAEHGETELIADVALEITTGFSLAEAEKKRSSGLSGSKPAEIQALDGTAESVSPEDSQGSETATADLTGSSYTLRN